MNCGERGGQKSIGKGAYSTSCSSKDEVILHRGKVMFCHNCGWCLCFVSFVYSYLMIAREMSRIIVNILESVRFYPTLDLGGWGLQRRGIPLLGQNFV
jgi:hypothetical protein